MKKLNLVLILLSSIIFLRCAFRNPPLIPKPPLNNHLTEGAESLLRSYQRLFNDLHVCDTINFKVWGDTAVMPANQYRLFTTNKDSLVSFSSSFNNIKTQNDELQNIWDCRSGAYAYYGVCSPGKIHFPYDCAYSDDVFYSKLVPVDSFRKAFHLRTDTLAPVWDFRHIIKGLALADSVSSIEGFYLEPSGGFISNAYKIQYNNKYSALGIICTVKTKAGKIIHCYLINNDMQSNNSVSGLLLWKK